MKNDDTRMGPENSASIQFKFEDCQPEVRKLISDLAELIYEASISSQREYGLEDCSMITHGANLSASISTEGLDDFKEICGQVIAFIAYRRVSHFARYVSGNEDSDTMPSIVLHPRSSFPSEGRVAQAMFLLMPAEKADDALACLEDLFESRFLIICDGDEGKAAQIARWQMFGYIWRYHRAGLFASASAIGGYLGIRKVGDALKGWFSN